MGWIAKWTFREPILAWTAYWTLAGVTLPFAVKAAIEHFNPPEAKQPPALKDMIEAIRAQHSSGGSSSSS
jgi:hypothetical protein